MVLSGGGSRGSFQIGVWKYLVERNWKPDIICGTSIGAINAAGIVSGLDVATLARLWTHSNRRNMYRLNLIEFLLFCFSGKALKPLFDTRQLETLISDHLDFKAIKGNPTKLVIPAVNVHTAQPTYFKNADIELEHVLASSAMPILFPSHEIGGVEHWDGGTMANIPLQPALDFDADEIIIVNLSPIGNVAHPYPKTLRTALEHVFEQLLIGSYHNALMANTNMTNTDNPIQTQYTKKYNSSDTSLNQPNIVTLAPSKMLGFRSLINFSLPQAKRLIDEGYQTANIKLKPFI